MWVFKIHEQTRIHSGHLRGIIYDLSRSSHTFLPLALVNALKELEGSPLRAIEQRLKDLGLGNGNWIERLFKEEILFMTPEEFAPNFEPLDLRYERPGALNAAVLHFSWADHDVLSVLDEHNCEHLAVEIEPKHIKELPTFWKTMGKLSMNWVSLHLNHSPSISRMISRIVGRKPSPKLRQICIHGAPFNKGEVNRTVPVLYVALPTPGQGHKPCLIMHQDIYMEALAYNPYFNRKLFINAEGLLNAANETSIPLGRKRQRAAAVRAYIENLGNHSLWRISKDMVSVCRDCELRYMCIDSRVPVRRTDGTYYYESECDYNPYIARWRDQDEFIPLSACGVVNDVEGFSIDSKRVNRINAELWGE